MLFAGAALSYLEFLVMLAQRERPLVRECASAGSSAAAPESSSNVDTRKGCFYRNPSLSSSLACYSRRLLLMCAGAARQVSDPTPLASTICHVFALEWSHSPGAETRSADRRDATRQVRVRTRKAVRSTESKNKEGLKAEICVRANFPII